MTRCTTPRRHVASGPGWTRLVLQLGVVASCNAFVVGCAPSTRYEQPDALRPGDVLLFSARPGAGVTHVGMWVGELKFIHSSNRGVKLSRLDPQDPEGAYWLDRLVGARRIIP